MSDSPLTLEPFSTRHIGPREDEIVQMLAAIGAQSLTDLANRTVPEPLHLTTPLDLPGTSPSEAPLSEQDALEQLSAIAKKNVVCTSLIGQGYYGTIIPPVIRRNILENPGWYTQYTPYQAEISQGRLEALLNFQTVVSDLTALPIANASLLDEGTAAAEAMTLCHRMAGQGSRTKFYVSPSCHPQTIDVIRTRAWPLGFTVVCPEIDDPELITSEFFGALVQYPATDGAIKDWSSFAKRAHSVSALLVVATDLLALTLLRAPGEWGADIALGNSQRFGVPLGFGGPHAAFFAVTAALQRQLPGRLIGVSKDSSGRAALRLALQTREQHIRREKATSNICTAQVLLAILASMYAVYHGPQGLRRIARRVNTLTASLAHSLAKLGFAPLYPSCFDTVTIKPGAEQVEQIRARAQKEKLNFRYFESGDALAVSLDETATAELVAKILCVITGRSDISAPIAAGGELSTLPPELQRTSDFLAQPVFHRHHSETEFLRYVRKLESRDLSLTASMIPLGSCTMKLNAAAEMLPITWPEFANIHPFAPENQVRGYKLLISQLCQWLAEATGLPAVSLQPNAGAQGEYTGLLVIRAYHEARKHPERNVCLIPQSAHGTNPASAAMAGFQVVTIACDEQGRIDLDDLRAKLKEHKKRVAAIMMTYPSTYGVFEETAEEICRLVHAAGALVYMDGANMNAQVGLCRPGNFGVDICHLNLHKTFAIPHGGGGPGVGPIAAAKHLARFLPGHRAGGVGAKQAIGAVCSAPYGSASILPIPWMYIKLMGATGLRLATQAAILNANYVAARLHPYFPVLYRGANGFVAHECILDVHPLKKVSGIEVEDIAKRLMDYGFHAPTVSFPVHDTLMVEPTESESKFELDRFCDAMISIYREIVEVAEGRADRLNNVLKNAPHTAQDVTADTWSHPYSREAAAYPVPSLRGFKFWPSVGRIDNVYGDRNLVCRCAAG